MKIFSLALSSAILLAGAFWLRLIPDADMFSGRGIAAYALLAAGGFGSAALLWSRRGDRILILMLAVGGLARILLLPHPPTFSHDAYRYVWDGRVLLHGYDPYVVTPENPSLHSLRLDWLYQYIDFRSVPTLYPPLDLALFALGDWLDDKGTLGIKVLVELADIAALALLILLLRRRGLAEGRAALYALNPLVIFEFAQGGHEEAWVVAALLATLILCESGRRIAGGVMLGVAALIKLYPLALLPAIFPRRWWRPAIACLTVIVIGYVPFYLWNPNVFGFLREFTLQHRYNETPIAFIGPIGVIILFAAAIIAATIARRRGADLVVTLIALELAYLLLSPNVYPWYVTVFAALVPALPGAFAARLLPISIGLIGWTLTAPLAYASGNVVASGSTEEIALRALEYAPVVIGLAIYSARAVSKRMVIVLVILMLVACARINSRDYIVDARMTARDHVIEGRALYTQHCAVCHTPTATSFIGPDLTHIARRRSFVRLYEHIRTSVTGPESSRRQARALAAYLISFDERKR